MDGGKSNEIYGGFMVFMEVHMLYSWWLNKEILGGNFKLLNGMMRGSQKKMQ